MSDHGSVQTVLGHNTAAAPALLLFPPLGSTVLKPHLEQLTETIIIQYALIPNVHLLITEGFTPVVNLIH